MCWTPLLNAETDTHKAVETLKLTQKKSNIGELTITTTYRGNVKILQKATPLDESMNTVFYVFLHGVKVFTYKSGPMGTEFLGAGPVRQVGKPAYIIKMAGDKKSEIQRITIYSVAFKTTFDGFWLKDNELIPWSAEELENWRKLRSSVSQ